VQAEVYMVQVLSSRSHKAWEFATQVGYHVHPELSLFWKCGLEPASRFQKLVDGEATQCQSANPTLIHVVVMLNERAADNAQHFDDSVFGLSSAPIPSPSKARVSAKDQSIEHQLHERAPRH